MDTSEKALIRPTGSNGPQAIDFRRIVRLLGVLGVLSLTAAPRAYSEPALPARPAANPAAGLTLLPRVEDRRGFTRLTFPRPARGTYSFRREGEKLVIVRPRNTVIQDLPQLPRNVLEIASDPAATVVTLGAGVRTRVDHARGNLVVTVYDPTPPNIQPAPPASARATLTATAETGSPSAPPAAAPPAAEPEPAAKADTLQSKPAAVGAKPELTPIQPISGVGQPAILLPATGATGLAAFRLRDETVVVIDKPIDFQAPLADPTFGTLTTQKTEDATVIRIPLRDPGLVRVDRSQQGWVVTAGARRETVDNVIPLPVELSPGASGVRLTVSEPGRVVALTDPLNGALLLVGTQNASGQAVLEPREYSRYRLLPTVQGVVIAPRSQDVSVHREGSSFLLTAGSPGGDAAQPDAAPPVASAPIRARLFDLHNESAAALLDRLHHDIRAVSEAPSLARTDLRLKIGETMVGLGLGVEAQSVLDVAAASDPSLLNLPYAMGLRAAAAILAGRLDAASAIADPRVSATSDGRLWRSLLAVAKEQVSAEDAKTLAAEMPVLLSYPPTLRDKLLPQALESLAVSGQAGLANDVLATLPATPELDLARGMTFEIQDQPADALQQYDKVAARPDRKAAYRASIRAVELRIKIGALDETAGADALDRNLFGWREPAQEIPLRIRIAALRRQSGQWRDAVTVLKEGIIAFPENRAQLDGELAQTLLALFTGDAAKSLSPADLVALYDKNIETVQSMTWPEPIGLKLAGHLIQLGLPARAEPVLAKLVAQATSPDRRPFLGARLADVRLQLNDPAGAIAALAGTAPAAGGAMDPVTMRSRQMLYAQAEIERGNTEAAASMLQTIGTAEADSARADIYVAQKDWARAEAALTALEQKSVPQTGSLTQEQQAIVTRLAVAAALSEDAATLKRITDTYGAAMASTASGNLFRIITSSPVRGTSDLPRAFEEIQLARKVTAQAGALTTP